MESHRQPEDAKEPTTLQLKAILLVDDDKQLASALQWILADQNFLVDVAFDGKELLVSCVGQNTITRVDPMNGANLGTIMISGGPTSIQCQQITVRPSDCA